MQDPAATTHSSEPFTIARAFNALQSWEDSRDGDLVAENRREVGVVYNDGPFSAGVNINDSRTDAVRFLKLTVAPIHRHKGSAEPVLSWTA